MGGFFLQIDQLKYIVAIDKHKSISKASQVLHVSQSAISQSLNKLESELEIVIFERLYSGVKATEAGRHLISIAEDILLNIEVFKRDATKYKELNQNELKIGLVSGLHLPFLPNILAKIKKEFPNQKITFVENSSLEIIESIITNELDVGIICIYEETLKFKEVVSFRRFQEINFFALVEKDSLFSNMTTLHPYELINQTFVMFNGEFMKWFFEKFKDKYGNFQVLLTTKNNETIRETVKNGLAITIETDVEIVNNHYIRNGDIVPIPLTENIPEKSYRGLAYLKNKNFSQGAKTFMKYLEQEIQQMLGKETQGDDKI